MAVAQAARVRAAVLVRRVTLPPGVKDGSSLTGVDGDGERLRRPRCRRRRWPCRRCRMSVTVTVALPKALAAGVKVSVAVRRDRRLHREERVVVVAMTLNVTRLARLVGRTGADGRGPAGGVRAGVFEHGHVAAAGEGRRVVDRVDGDGEGLRSARCRRRRWRCRRCPAGTRSRWPCRSRSRPACRSACRSARCDGCDAEERVVVVRDVERQTSGRSRSDRREMPVAHAGDCLRPGVLVRRSDVAARR